MRVVYFLWKTLRLVAKKRGLPVYLSWLNIGTNPPAQLIATPGHHTFTEDESMRADT